MQARFRLPFGWRTCSVILQSRARVAGKSFVVTYSLPTGDDSSYLLDAVGLPWSNGLQSHFQYLPAGNPGEVALSAITFPAEVEEIDVVVRPWQGTRVGALKALHSLALRVDCPPNTVPGGRVLVKPERAAA